jgi:hypothetical protein
MIHIGPEQVEEHPQLSKRNVRKLPEGEHLRTLECVTNDTILIEFRSSTVRCGRTDHLIL